MDGWVGAWVGGGKGKIDQVTPNPPENSGWVSVTTMDMKTWTWKFQSATIFQKIKNSAWVSYMETDLYKSKT
jgi:hypothetical protein